MCQVQKMISSAAIYQALEIRQNILKHAKWISYKKYVHLRNHEIQYVKNAKIIITSNYFQKSEKL